MKTDDNLHDIIFTLKLIENSCNNITKYIELGGNFKFIIDISDKFNVNRNYKISNKYDILLSDEDKFSVDNTKCYYTTIIVAHKYLTIASFLLYLIKTNSTIYIYNDITYQSWSELFSTLLLNDITHKIQIEYLNLSQWKLATNKIWIYVDPRQYDSNYWVEKQLQELIVNNS